MKNHLWRRLMFVFGASLLLAACGGGGNDEEVIAPPPTATAVPLTIGGSPLDAVDNTSLADQELAAPLEPEVVDDVLEPQAIDCQVHADDPSTCEEAFAPAGDGLQAAQFDDSLWNFEMNGFPVYTNINTAYPIEEVIADSIELARAEFAGDQQALFPHLANRRTAPKYEEIAVWSATFLFAPDPVSNPAEVKIAVEGTTADGEKFDELISFFWQWTEERWVPEWESLIPESTRPDFEIEEPADADADGEESEESASTEDASGDAESGDVEESESTEDSASGPASEAPSPPPSGATFCPPGFPYAHYNGLCYANPINPRDQVGGPTISQAEWELFRASN